MTGPAGSQRRRRPGSREPGGRSILLPFYVVVIVGSIIAIVAVVGPRFGGDDSSEFAQLVESSEVRADVTSFWTEEGGPLVSRWRLLSPVVLTDIADGGTCIPSHDVAAARCPSIPDALAGHLPALQELITDARSYAPPADSTAPEWLALQIAGWEELHGQISQFSEIGRAGWDDDAWRAAMVQYRETDLLGAAERALGRMLLEVEPRERAPAGLRG